MNMNRMLMFSFTVWRLRRASCKLGKNLLFCRLLFGIKYILNITLSLSAATDLFPYLFPENSPKVITLVLIWATFNFGIHGSLLCSIYCLYACFHGHLVYPGQITCSGLYYSIDLCKGKHNMFSWSSLRLKHASGFAIKTISIYSTQWMLENM